MLHSFITNLGLFKYTLQSFVLFWVLTLDKLVALNRVTYNNTSNECLLNLETASRALRGSQVLQVRGHEYWKDELADDMTGERHISPGRET